MTERLLSRGEIITALNDVIEVLQRGMPDAGSPADGAVFLLEVLCVRLMADCEEERVGPMRRSFERAMAEATRLLEGSPRSSEQRAAADGQPQPQRQSDSRA